MADDQTYTYHAVERGGVTYQFLEQAEALAARAFQALKKLSQFADQRNSELVRVQLPGGQERIGFFVPHGQEPAADMAPLAPLTFMLHAIPKEAGWDRLYTAPCMGNHGSMCCEVNGLEKSLEELQDFRYAEKSLLQSVRNTEAELFTPHPGFVQHGVIEITLSDGDDINAVLADIMQKISRDPFAMMQAEVPEFSRVRALDSLASSPEPIDIKSNGLQASAHKIWKGEWIYRVPRSEHAFVPPAAKEISAWGANNLAHPMPLELFRSDHTRIWPAIEAIRPFPEKHPLFADRSPLFAEGRGRSKDARRLGMS